MLLQLKNGSLASRLAGSPVYNIECDESVRLEPSGFLICCLVRKLFVAALNTELAWLLPFWVSECVALACQSLVQLEYQIGIHAINKQQTS